MKRVLLILTIGAVAMSGCRKEPAPSPLTATQTATQTGGQTAAQKPAVAVKLTIAFLPEEKPSEATTQAAQKVADSLKESTGYDIEVLFPKTYAESIRALKEQKAQVVFLTSWAYLKAHMAAGADLLLVEERKGKTSFGSNWYVAKDSKLKTPKDLKGKRVAFTAPTSAAGFLLPYAGLIADGVLVPGKEVKEAFKEVYFAGDEGALRSLLEGKVDAAAGPDFALETYLSEDERGRVRVLASVGSVPTQGFAVHADIDPDVREKLKTALSAIDATMLKAAYGAEKLVAKSHGDHVMGLQEIQERVGTEYVLPNPKEEAAPAEEKPAGME